MTVASRKRTAFVIHNPRRVALPRAWRIFQGAEWFLRITMARRKGEQTSNANALQTNRPPMLPSKCVSRGRAKPRKIIIVAMLSVIYTPVCRSRAVSNSRQGEGWANDACCEAFRRLRRFFCLAWRCLLSTPLAVSAAQVAISAVASSAPLTLWLGCMSDLGIKRSRR